MEDRIKQLRVTDFGNRIGYDWNQDGPTPENLFTSYFLSECSAEWLAEQLDIPLAEVEKIGSLWNEDFQESTPETAQKLDEAIVKALGRETSQTIEEKAAFNKLLGDIEVDL